MVYNIKSRSRPALAYFVFQFSRTKVTEAAACHFLPHSKPDSCCGTGLIKICACREILSADTVRCYWQFMALLIRKKKKDYLTNCERVNGSKPISTMNWQNKRAGQTTTEHNVISVYYKWLSSVFYNIIFKWKSSVADVCFIWTERIDTCKRSLSLFSVKVHCSIKCVCVLQERPQCFSSGI